MQQAAVALKSRTRREILRRGVAGMVASGCALCLSLAVVNAKRKRRAASWAAATILLGWIAAAWGANTAGAAKECGPFGNSPVRFIKAPKPWCLSGKLLGPWNDSDGNPRYACVFEPKAVGAAPKGDASAQSKWPMVVFLHPSLAPAGIVRATNLVALQDDVSISGNGEPGYIVLVPQGRKTSHFYAFPDDTGYGWDNWYRQLNPAGDVTIGGATYKENVDAAAIDKFIADEVATGKVDTDRIYVTGWSNGGAMGILYALNRPSIAAAAVYSAPDPFAAFTDPCQQKPVSGQATSNDQVQLFNPGVPLMHVHNQCDIGGLCPNGERMAERLRAAGLSVENIMLDSFGFQVQGCYQLCGSNPNGSGALAGDPLGPDLGAWNHARWPLSWTRKMLEFLAKHSLSARKAGTGLIVGGD
jgi:predicted esterase